MVQTWAETVSARLSFDSSGAGSSSKGLPGPSPPSPSGSVLNGPSMVLGPNISTTGHSMRKSQVQGTIFHPKLESWKSGNSCLDFAPGDVRDILHPRPDLIPKVHSMAGQPVVLQASLPLAHEIQKQESLHLLYPKHALRIYVHPSCQWPEYSQLLVCFGGHSVVH